MNAQRASAPVRFARLAAAVLLAGLTVVIAVRLAGRRGGPPSLPVEPPPAGRIADLQERVRQQEFKDGRAVADIRGKTFFRGPDGRNHLQGSVEFANLGPGGEMLSRLTADEIVYDPGSLLFTVAGHVRVESGGLVLEGDSFDYDKTAGLFGTKSGGRFMSGTVSGRAPEISFREKTDEIRLGGGFQFQVPEAVEAGPGRRVLTVSGRSLVLDRRGRLGRIDGQASIQGADFRGTSEAASFVASPDEAALESAVLAGAAKVVFVGQGTSGEGSGEIRAERIAVSFSRVPYGLAVKTSGPSELSLRSAADETETVFAPEVLLSFDRVEGRCAWSASGGIRAELEAAGSVRRALEGTDATFDSAKILHVSGGSGRPAVADSAEARIEAPSISVATDGGGLLAKGGVSCVLKSGAAGRRIGFFPQGRDVLASCERLELRPETQATFLTGNVVVRQGADTVRAAEIELGGDSGRMSGGGGVAITLTETAGTRPRTIELGGQDMAYRPDSRTIALSSKAVIRLPEARLEAGSVSAVLAREGTGVESLAATKDVVVSKARYEGRSEAASYLAATDRITLTGRPVLTDGKGGSARGDKLTFDLADDKIFIENEGSGRATTVVRS